METTSVLKIRVFKKYQNRKLYDTHKSAYVTLKQIYDCYNDGFNVKVIGPKNQDITKEILIQSIVYARMNDQKFLNMILENGRT